MRRDQDWAANETLRKTHARKWLSSSTETPTDSLAAKLGMQSGDTKSGCYEHNYQVAQTTDPRPNL
jgi:hypothetical protein